MGPAAAAGLRPRTERGESAWGGPDDEPIDNDQERYIIAAPHLCQR